MTGIELDKIATELAMLGRYIGVAAVEGLSLTVNEARFVRFQVIRKTRTEVAS